MPTNRLIFLMFVIVLVAAIVYLRKVPEPPAEAPATLTPKQYIERVEAGKAQQTAPAPSTREQ